MYFNTDDTTRLGTFQKVSSKILIDCETQTFSKQQQLFHQEIIYKYARPSKDRNPYESKRAKNVMRGNLRYTSAPNSVGVSPSLTGHCMDMLYPFLMLVVVAECNIKCFSGLKFSKTCFSDVKFAKTCLFGERKKCPISCYKNGMYATPGVYCIIWLTKLNDH